MAGDIPRTRPTTESNNVNLLDFFFGETIVGGSSIVCALLYVICSQSDPNSPDLCYHRRLQRFREYKNVLQSRGFDDVQKQMLAGSGFLAMEEGELKCFCCGFCLVMNSAGCCKETVQGAHKQNCALTPFFSGSGNIEFQRFLKHLREEMHSTKVSVAELMGYSMKEVIYSIGSQFIKTGKGYRNAGDLVDSLGDEDLWYIPELSKDLFLDVLVSLLDPPADSTDGGQHQTQESVSMATTSHSNKKVEILCDFGYDVSRIHSVMQTLGPSSIQTLINALQEEDDLKLQRITSDVNNIYAKATGYSNTQFVTNSSDRAHFNTVSQQISMATTVIPVEQVVVTPRRRTQSCNF